MLNIIIGIIIGTMITLLINGIHHYLKANHLIMNWRNLFIALGILVFILYLMYSFIGMIFGPIYTKSNGNVCQGNTYGIKRCTGNINAE